jgi:hypothetical protein
MTFGITPVTSFPPAAATSFPKLLQFQDDGIALGDRGVRVVNIVADPLVVQATRGVGENSNVVTISMPNLLDPLGDNVALLMFFQGVDGDISGAGFVDYSHNAAVPTRFAGSPVGATIKATYAGPISGQASSIYFPSSHNTSTASGLNLPSIQPYEFLGDNFCIEYFSYFDSNPAAAIESQIVKSSNINPSGTGSWWLNYSHLSGVMSFGYRVGGVRTVLNLPVVSTYTLNSWHAVCVERYANNLYFYLDGVLQSTAVLTDVIDTSAIDLTVGVINFAGYGPTESFSGYMGMLRLTTQMASGVSRYFGASSYTVTTVPFRTP